MRLLILSNLYPPNVVGGYERLCFEVTSALAARGYEITVLTSDYGGRTEEIAGQTVLREWTLLAGEHIYAPFTGDREAVNQHNSAVLTRTLANVKPDIVFSWNLFFLDAGILQQLETCGVRTVVMLTDNWLLNMRNPPFWPRYWQEHVIGNAAFNPPPARPPLPAYKRLAARLLRRPLGLEAIFGAAYVRDFYAAGGVTFPVYRVIHNGVRQPVSAASPALDRTKLVTPGILRLLFAGRMVDVKGPDLCVDMLSHLAVDGLRVELTLLGDMQNAEYAAHLRTRVEASGFRDHITLRAPVTEADLPALFAAHDIYLFPSRYEPFSLTLIHALSEGIPTVASRVGGNPEIVRDGESGLLFAKDDVAAMATAVARLARDGALRQRVADEGRRSASRYTFERMVASMDAFLRRAA